MLRVFRQPGGKAVAEFFVAILTLEERVVWGYFGEQGAVREPDEPE
jgi:hypothetical protein